MGQITPKWDKFGTFQIGKPKCTKILSEKVGFFLPTLEPNLISLFVTDSDSVLRPIFNTDGIVLRSRLSLRLCVSSV